VFVLHSCFLLCPQMSNEWPLSSDPAEEDFPVGSVLDNRSSARLSKVCLIPSLRTGDKILIGSHKMGGSLKAQIQSEAQLSSWLKWINEKMWSIMISCEGCMIRETADLSKTHTVCTQGWAVWSKSSFYITVIEYITIWLFQLH